MANNDQLINQIRKVVREEVKIEVEPINKRLDSLVKGQTRLEQGQGQLETSVNAIAAGQTDLQGQIKNIQETMATKADVLNVSVKVDKLRKRVESVEEDTDSTPRHKN